MGGQKPEASRVLEKVCLAKKIPFFKAEPEKALTQKDSLEGQYFCTTVTDWKFLWQKLPEGECGNCL